ncbi:hypothetical protein V1511DRAFT_493477 [Dipodascopsis uninucleata]
MHTQGTTQPNFIVFVYSRIIKYGFDVTAAVSNIRQSLRANGHRQSDETETNKVNANSHSANTNTTVNDENINYYHEISVDDGNVNFVVHSTEGVPRDDILREFKSRNHCVDLVGASAMRSKATSGLIIKHAKFASQATSTAPLTITKNRMRHASQDHVKKVSKINSTSRDIVRRASLPEQRDILQRNLTQSSADALVIAAETALLNAAMSRRKKSSRRCISLFAFPLPLFRREQSRLHQEDGQLVPIHYRNFLKGWASSDYRLHAIRIYSLVPLGYSSQTSRSISASPWYSCSSDKSVFRRPRLCHFFSCIYFLAYYAIWRSEILL